MTTPTSEIELIERLYAELREYRRLGHHTVDNFGELDSDGHWVKITSWLPVDVMHRTDRLLETVKEWRVRRIVNLGDAA
jgi:ribonucleotide reductase alpha subunit